jgi:predicted extracellular nuclease
MTKFARSIHTLTAAAALSGLFATLASAVTNDPMLLNEIFASHTGTDDTEFIELYGNPGTLLEGLSLIIVEGDAFAAGTIDRRIDLKPFQKIGPNGFFLIGNCVGLAKNYGVIPDKAIFTNYIENSSLTAALVETASLTRDFVTGMEIVYDTVALRDSDADLNGDQFFFDAPVLGPDGDFFPAGARREQDGVDNDTVFDWLFADFFVGPDNTPTGGGLDGCAPLLVTIPQIQGDAERSPYEGEIVTTSGVVTLLTRDQRSFWIQDPAGDNDPATSDGIFVFRGGDVTPVQVGDRVTVTATVSEYVRSTRPNDLPLTELASVLKVELDSSGNPLPAPVLLEDLPDVSIPDGIDFWEPLEGMLAVVDEGRVVAPTTRFGEFAMLTQHDARPGSGYFPQTEQILLQSLGDNEVDYNPERILVDDESIDVGTIQVIPGDRVLGLTGVVDYTFSNYKLQPSPNSFQIENQEIPDFPVSKRSGPHGDLRITSFNVENLFDLIDNPDKDDEGSTPTSEELETKLSKLALAIEQELELPAILVVQEVENTEILQELGDRVYVSSGTNYRAVSFESSDSRGIEVGFLWDDDRVVLMDAFQLTDDIVPGVSDAFGDNSASPGREPLVGLFRIKEDDEQERHYHGNRQKRRSDYQPDRDHPEDEFITIIGNHFKSKGGDDPLYGVNQPPIRTTEDQRKLQAQVVRDYVDLLFDSNRNAKLIITGDLNDFQFGEPGEGSDHPLAIMEGMDEGLPKSRVLTNLIHWEKRAETFTYVFDGNSQVLDHMLVSREMLEDVEAVDILHFNAGYPNDLGADPTTPLRSSDHDPLELRLETE